MSSADRGRDQPRAMVHRRILDVAAADPDASMEAIADEVSGASPALVERVLDEYGDPGREDESAEGHGGAIGSPNSDGSAGHVTPDGTSSDTSDIDGVDAGADGDATDDEETVVAGDNAATEDAATDETSTDGGTTGLDIATSADDAPTADETPTDDTEPERDTDSDDTVTRRGVDSEGLTGGDQTAAADDGATTEDDDPDLPPAIDSLSDKQRRTLRALYERPNASQGDLAEELDVTRATVCRRLNAIPGFEWSDRRAFAESVFGADAASDGGSTAIRSATPENDRGPGSDDGGSGTEATDSGDATDRDAESVRSVVRSDSGSGRDSGDTGSSSEVGASPGTTDRRLAAVEDRLAAIESRLDETGAGEGTDFSLSPELAHKVVHACMESDRLTEDEELDVLRSLME